MAEVHKSVKLVLLGDSGVGKTSIVQQFTEGKFLEDNVSTIGVSYFEKTEEFDGKTVAFQVWDTAGQETYRSLASLYYRGAAAAVIVYDITRKESFKGAKFWRKEMQKHEPDVVMALCGNKSDLEDERQISFEVAHEFAQANGMLHFETSAKTSSNIKALFGEIAKHVPVKGDEDALPVLSVGARQSGGKKKCPC